MNLYQNWLRIVEDNKNNPRPHLYFMTMCLKNWKIRREVYLSMKSTTRTDSARRLMHTNCWGEDTFIKRLIKENYPVQNMLALLVESEIMERHMEDTEVFNKKHLVIPLLEKHTEMLLPLWRTEVKKYNIQKEHPNIRKIIYFVLNLRDYNETKNNETIIDYFLLLLNEN